MRKEAFAYWAKVSAEAVKAEREACKNLAIKKGRQYASQVGKPTPITDMANIIADAIEARGHE